jgi:hypothetical protein
VIEQQNCTQKLTELLKSTDEGVGRSIVCPQTNIVVHESCLVCLATYAAAILFRLSDEKPYDTKKRFSHDVTSAIYRDEHLTNNVSGVSFFVVVGP